MQPANREDLSRFLVHLTRDYEGTKARDNLISILLDKTIEARNPHCLFMHEIDRLRFSQVLRKAFCTVCFTETPLAQVRRLTTAIPGRKVEFKGYGLVFLKETLLQRGASPAIYLNAKGTSLRDYLLSRFRSDFDSINKLCKLKRLHTEHHGSIIQYYSLINIIADNYDFMWEREWRYSGAFEFEYSDLIAIVAPDPKWFESYCKDQLPPETLRYIDMVPIISLRWSYEEVVETMSIKVWNNTLAHMRADA